MILFDKFPSCLLTRRELFVIMRVPKGKGETNMKTKQDLIEKAKKDWKKNWKETDIDYEAETNTYTVWMKKCKAFFNADTLTCLGTKEH